MGDEIVKTPAMMTAPAVAKAPGVASPPAAVSPPTVPNAPAVAKAPAAAKAPEVVGSPVVGAPKSKKWLYWVIGVVVISVVLGILVYSFSGGSVANVLGGGQRGALEDAYYDFNVPSNCYGDRFESLDVCKKSFKCISRKFSSIVREEDVEGLIDKINTNGNSAVAIYLNENPSLNAEFEEKILDCEF